MVQGIDRTIGHAIGLDIEVGHELGLLLGLGPLQSGVLHGRMDSSRREVLSKGRLQGDHIFRGDLLPLELEVTQHLESSSDLGVLGQSASVSRRRRPGLLVDLDAPRLSHSQKELLLVFDIRHVQRHSGREQCLTHSLIGLRVVSPLHHQTTDLGDHEPVVDRDLMRIRASLCSQALDLTHGRHEGLIGTTHTSVATVQGPHVVPVQQVLIELSLTKQVEEQVRTQRLIEGDHLGVGLVGRVLSTLDHRSLVRSVLDHAVTQLIARNFSRSSTNEANQFRFDHSQTLDRIGEDGQGLESVLNTLTLTRTHPLEGSELRLSILTGDHRFLGELQNANLIRRHRSDQLSSHRFGDAPNKAFSHVLVRLDTPEAGDHPGQVTLGLLDRSVVVEGRLHLRSDIRLFDVQNFGDLLGSHVLLTTALSGNHPLQASENSRLEQLRAIPIGAILGLLDQVQRLAGTPVLRTILSPQQIRELAFFDRLVQEPLKLGFDEFLNVFSLTQDTLIGGNELVSELELTARHRLEGVG